MKLITEMFDNFEILTEGKGGKDLKIKGVFMQAETKNRNGRMYPISILSKEVKRYNKELVEPKRAFGELGHPEGPTVNLDRVSHLIEELYEDGNNIIGKAKILDTPNGKIVKEFQITDYSVGNKSFIWNANSFSSGIYFVIINDGATFRTHKVMLLK